MSDNLALAHEYARAGLFVFPASNRTKVPYVERGNDWNDYSTIYAEHVAKWAANTVPAINMRKAGLIVIDCDRHGGPDGVNLFKAACQSSSGLPDGTPIVRTPSGGLHLYFSQPAGREPLGCARGDLPPAVDVRGRGGYVIAPRSTLFDGRQYEPVAGTPDLIDAFFAAAVPEIPVWIIDLIEAPKRAYEARKQYTPPPAPKDGDTDERWSASALNAECQKIAGAAQGMRNHTLFTAAGAMGSLIAAGYFSRQHVEQTLLNAALAAGLTPREAATAMKSGIDRGLTQPRQRPERQRLTPAARRYSFTFPKKATA